MIKKSLSLLIVLGMLVIGCPSGRTQTTQVSATVTDTNSTPYASGTYSISLVDSSGNPLSGATLCASNTPVVPSSFNGSMDSSGTFSVPILPSAAICPSGSKWRVQICSAKPDTYQKTAILYPLPHCFSSSFTISGTTQSLSSSLSALAPIIYWFNMNTGQGEWIGSGTGGDTITSPNSTLTVGGTVTNTTLDVNLANANTWAALQTFGTNISIGGVTATGATGTGNVVFATSPTIATPSISSPTLTGTPDASTATQFKLPVAAGATTLANGEFKYDTTNLNWHAWANSVDNLVVIVPASTSLTNGHCVQWVVVGGAVSVGDTGSACGSGGGGTGFSAITSGTNTTAAMVIGTGASLAVTGSGTNAATSAPFSGLSGSTNTTAAMVVGSGASIATTGTGTITATTVASASSSTSASFFLCFMAANTTTFQACNTSAGLTFNPATGALVSTSVATTSSTVFMGANRLTGSSTTIIGFTTGASGGGTIDTSVCREGTAGKLEVGSGATCANTGIVDASAYQISGAAASGNYLRGNGTSFVSNTIQVGDLPAVPLSGLATQAANTVVGNGTGSTAVPTALSVPSCSGTTSALIWTSGTGFGCHTISGGTPAESSITAPVASSTITETALGDWIARNGVETANLTAPWSFANTNSTNNNTSIGLLIGAAGTSTGGIGAVIYDVSGTGDILRLYSGGSVANNVYTPGTLEAHIDASGNGTFAGTGTFGSGTGNALDAPETTIGSANSGHDILAANSTTHTLQLSNNGGSFFTVAQTVASGTAAMGTSAISSGTCATVVTVSATGVATTDTIDYTPNADPTGVTGYAVSASGSLYIWAYPTSGNVNFKVCNNTSGSLTPSALTLNWRVAR